jgi:cytochrome c553
MRQRLLSAFKLLFALTLVVFINQNCTRGFNAVDMNLSNLSSLSDDALLAEKGKTIYANNCASCHSALDSSTKRDRNALAISNALSTVPQMSGLRAGLSNSDIDALAAALSTSGFCAPTQLGKTTVRRMNFREFVNSTTELLGNHSLAASDYPADTRGDKGFDNEGTGIRTLGPDSEMIMTAAEKVVDQVLANNSSKFNSCNTAANRPTCLKTLLTPVVRQAFRVPVAAAEVQPIIDFALAAPTPKEGMRDALVALIYSPRFLFHVVNYSANRVGITHSLSAHELAARMALFLWSSIPDETLNVLADSGEILKTDIQRQQVDRMLKDPRSKAFISSFPSQWLGYQSVAKATRNPSMHPDFTEALKASMIKEADFLFSDIVQRKLSADSLLTANYAFVDRTLASFYGITFPNTTSEFASVMLDGMNRRGILTQAAVMTSTSNNDYTNPIHRGVVFLNKVICQPVDQPPAGIPSLAQVDPSLPIKDRLALHRTSQTCASCHQHIDPMGLTFENFGATGKWRDTEGGHPVDSSGRTADGYSFNKPGELVGWISNGDKFEKCLNQYLATYAVGRGPQSGEKCYTDKVVKDKGSALGATFNDLVEGLVTSELFRKSSVRE